MSGDQCYMFPSIIHNILSINKIEWLNWLIVKKVCHNLLEKWHVQYIYDGKLVYQDSNPIKNYKFVKEYQ